MIDCSRCTEPAAVRAPITGTPYCGFHAREIVDDHLAADLLAEHEELLAAGIRHGRGTLYDYEIGDDGL